MTAIPAPLPARTDIENLIEALISILDDIEPDPDLEDNGDTEPNGDEEEPSLGSLDAQPQTRWSCAGDATALDVDCERDDADKEPSLGSTGCLGNDNQELSWGACSGTSDDREAEHDGREPDHDDEPDYRRYGIPPKGYMHPEDLLRLDFPHAGLKGAAAK